MGNAQNHKSFVRGLNRAANQILKKSKPQKPRLSGEQRYAQSVSEKVVIPKNK